MCSVGWVMTASVKSSLMCPLQPLVKLIRREPPVPGGDAERLGDPVPVLV
jgi:hypothetical protein